MIFIGPRYSYAPDGLDIGPARRVFDLVYLRGTTPGYTLPELDEGLIDALRAAFATKPGDRCQPGVRQETWAAFLAKRQGWACGPIEMPMIVSES